MVNLSIYEADPDRSHVADGRRKSDKTEVKMVPAAADPTITFPELWPLDGRVEGVPDPRLAGPNWIQIGGDAGFLPKPVEIPAQPITYHIDPTAFWVGNVKDVALALGPAERADAIVDFTSMAGKTFIVYNDAPAAWPAGVWSYDYYTGAPDCRDSGGYGEGGTWDGTEWVRGRPRHPPRLRPEHPDRDADRRAQHPGRTDPGLHLRQDRPDQRVHHPRTGRETPPRLGEGKTALRPRPGADPCRPGGL